jgi:hypothetical protein
VFFGINNLGLSHPHPVCSTRDTSYLSGPVVEEDVRVFVLRGTAESLTRILYSAESAGSVVQPFLSAPILATALFCGHVQQSQLVYSASDAVFRSLTVSIVSAVPSGNVVARTGSVEHSSSGFDSEGRPRQLAVVARSRSAEPVRFPPSILISILERIGPQATDRKRVRSGREGCGRSSCLIFWKRLLSMHFKSMSAYFFSVSHIDSYVQADLPVLGRLAHLVAFSPSSFRRLGV